MATIEDAFALAERLAVEQTVRSERLHHGRVEEFAHGWCVWTVEADPGDRPPELGSGAKTVLDRATGMLEHFPAWPTEMIAERYRPGSADRPPWPPVPSQAEVKAMWPGPARIAMILTSDNVVLRATAARDDAEPAHHPLVAGWLAAQPAGHLVRGAARHADMVLLSQVLTRFAVTDLDGVARARSGLLIARPESYAPLPLSRDGRTRSLACCRSCHGAWTHAGLAADLPDPASPGHLSGAALAEAVRADFARKGMTLPERPPPGAAPLRLPSPVAGAIEAGGWWYAVTEPERVALLVREIHEAADGGYAESAMAAARAVFERCVELSADERGPGRDCARSQFDITMSARPYDAPPAGAFERRLGVPVFPIGVEGRWRDPLVVDAHGRVFVLDQAGDWLLGEDLDEALTTLVEGRMPRRLRADGAFAPAA